jgi:toxin ParE1/3/4
MDLRWTEDAAADVERIADYLFEHLPVRAADLVTKIFNVPGDLLIFPNRGRPGKMPGTRELVLTPLPYLVVYRIEGESIQILRILHGAQKWP